MRKLLIFTSLTLSCLLLCSCIKLGGKLEPRKTYLLSLPKQQASKTHLTKSVLEVMATTAASPFDLNEFIYRVSGGRFISDYYHSFLASPNEQITDLVIRYFGNQPLFFDVMSASNQTSVPDYTLQARIVDLYADYQNSQRPQAVMTLRFQLFHQPNSVLKFSQLYSARVPLKKKTNEALVLAWNRCLIKILNAVYQKVYHVVLE